MAEQTHGSLGLENPCNVLSPSWAPPGALPSASSPAPASLPPTAASHLELRSGGKVKSECTLWRWDGSHVMRDLSCWELLFKSVCLRRTGFNSTNESKGGIIPVRSSNNEEKIGVVGEGMELSNNYPEFSINTPSKSKPACSRVQIPLLTTKSLGNHEEISLLGQ